jgi:signal transduction histidine kinase
VLERACTAVAHGFRFERVGIVRWIEETATLVPFAAVGLTPAEQIALPAALPATDFSAFGRALAAQQAIFVRDPGREESVPDDIVSRFGIGSFVIVPLISDGRCLGFMTCDQRGAAFALDASEVDLLTTFGTLIAAFLEKAIEHGELRRLNELKSQFAALASHELRTPVAAVFGAVRTLDEREDELTPEQRQSLRTILTQQSKRLFELVENLLDLSRLEADAIRVEPSEVNVAERLASHIAGVFEPGTDVTTAVPPSLVAVVDVHALDRIVSNLLINARRHGAPPYLVAASLVHGKLTVAVEDRGGGVAPAFVPNLFERFTRGTTDASEGAGLGLSIAHSYARAHGGTLSYAPAFPHGARFELTLSVGTARARRSRAPRTSELER